jgi:salicylate hydroxylase
MHVIIAGAGLGGLALALSLARQNIKSTIYEIRSHPSDAGGSITLTAGAVRVLDNPVGILDQLRAVAYSYTRMGAHLDDGYRFGDVLIGDEGLGGYPAFRIMRSGLQKVLLEACRKHGDLIEIQWGAKMEGIRGTEDGVSVGLQDGRSVKGKHIPPQSL